MINSGSIKKLEIKMKHLDMLRRVYTEGERIMKKPVNNNRQEMSENKFKDSGRSNRDGDGLGERQERNYIKPEC